MSDGNRRQWLKSLGLGALGLGAGRFAEAEARSCPAANQPLDLQDFHPKSMLHVAETRVLRARFPAIDTHTHLSEIESVV